MSAIPLQFPLAVDVLPTMSDVQKQIIADSLLTVEQTLVGGLTNVQAFTTPGAFTWTKPAKGGNWAEIICIGGGGGGGSGQYQAASTAGGGGGGSGGAYSIVKVPLSSLAATEPGSVGAGGTGGAAKTTVGNGNAGTA